MTENTFRQRNKTRKKYGVIDVRLTHKADHCKYLSSMLLNSPHKKRFFAKLGGEVKIEIGSFEINHRDEIINIFEAPSSAFDFLNATVNTFHSTSG